MVQIMNYNDNYYKIQEETNFATILYGAGKYGKRLLPYMKNVKCFCDKRADDIREVKGIEVIPVSKLCMQNETLLIVICAKNEKIRKEMIDELTKTAGLDAMVFELFDNEAFDHYMEKKLYVNGKKKEIKFINIICEDESWILGKFARNMRRELESQGYRCTIGDCVNSEADINHHITYSSCRPLLPFNETCMITHIDSYNKIEMIKHILKSLMIGICMSRDTMEKLVSYGVPREKLCYINPAQDGLIRQKKYVLGITHRCYDRIDNRKRTGALVDICKAIDPMYFSFKIMGAGWDGLVSEVRDMGFQIDYYSEFDYEEYMKLIPSLDYYLFWGFDEGSMGYLDALRAGIGTIVTPQGYHLDVKDGITYACRTIPDFIDILLKLQNDRKKIVQSVEGWTWKNFTDKHIEVWNYLLGNEENIYKNQHMYEDGIFSVMRYNA